MKSEQTTAGGPIRGEGVASVTLQPTNSREQPQNLNNPRRLWRMQINIEGLDNGKLMHGGFHHFNSNINYECNLNNDLVEGLLPMLKAIVEYDLITGQSNVVDDEQNGSLNDNTTLRAPIIITNIMCQICKAKAL